ncbi:MAG: hypothetical protein F6J98_15605, partial [Moorea sp. SIO4G2]|nr:hypothetical protein [Moorena sp. SIO4G2]
TRTACRVGKKRCSAVLGRQRGLGGSPHERLPWFSPLALCIKTGKKSSVPHYYQKRYKFSGSPSVAIIN